MSRRPYAGVRPIQAAPIAGAALGPGPVAPPTKGRLVYDFQIPDAFLGGLPGITDKLRWVRDHLPRATCIRIGRQSAWYEADVVAYVDSLQVERQARAS